MWNDRDAPVPPTLTRRLRAAWRLLRGAVHVLRGAAIVLLRWPSLDRPGRHARVAWWSARMLALLGIRCTVEGAFRSGATLLVANHVSWLDILAVHAVCPRARFVSKADVRHWPLVNRLVDAGGTLYLERERKRDALRVVHQTAEALRAGDMVAVFPEGTTGDGRELLPFHANLLQSAIVTATPVQAVALAYSDAAATVSPAVAWVGEDTLADSLWRIACADGLSVRLRVLPPQDSAHADRRALAARLRELIDQALREART